MKRIASLMLIVFLSLGLSLSARAEELSWRGPWSAAATYGAGAVVSYQVSFSISPKSSNLNHLPSIPGAQGPIRPYRQGMVPHWAASRNLSVG
jgi:hypothetical protein